MVRRYWKQGVAAFLCVLACFILVSLPYSLQHQSERRDARNAENYVTKEYIKLRCGSLPKSERALCAAQQRDAAAEKKRSEYDLKAQQEMAQWALLMLFATVLGLFVSAGGLVALVWTFREQRKLTEIQSRAYIEVVSGRIVLTERWSWSCEILLMNTGQTPAFEVTLDASAAYHFMSDDQGNPSGEPAMLDIENWTSEVGPSSVYTARMIMKGQIPYDGISGIKAPDGRIYHTEDHVLPKMVIVGSVFFDDAFGNPRTTIFHLESLDITDFGAYNLLGGTDRFYEEGIQAARRAEALKPAT